jgi:response regulator RpfG family c-di-GMP phosphodiesterase
LIHWNQTEAEQKAQTLHSAGYTVDYASFTPQTLKELKNNPPDTMVIDLSRLPSQGRDIAINIRHTKATRDIPIVFVEGDPQKLDQIRNLISDAIYTTYNQIHTALKQAIANPPKVTVVPKSIFEPYKHTPLAKKLGIKPNTTLALINPPKDFTKTLSKLPENTKTLKKANKQANLTILFTKTQKDLKTHITKTAATLAQNAKLWIAWQKKTPQTPTNLTQATVRQIGLAQGLVDYKICAIDQTWSALLFTKRKTKPPSKPL